jgi:hypothetical protein
MNKEMKQAMKEIDDINDFYLRLGLKLVIGLWIVIAIIIISL